MRTAFRIVGFFVMFAILIVVLLLTNKNQPEDDPPPAVPLIDHAEVKAYQDRVIAGIIKQTAGMIREASFQNGSTVLWVFVADKRFDGAGPLPNRNGLAVSLCVMAANPEYNPPAGVKPPIIVRVWDFYAASREKAPLLGYASC